MRGKQGFWLISILLLSACAPVSSASVDEVRTATMIPQPVATDLPPASDTLLPDEVPPAGAAREFTTDFSKHTIPYSEVLSGGPPKDGIPPIDDPKFVTVEEADGWLEDQEPVILMQVGDVARAYPIQILMWHEIVNDTLGGVPVAVTFCPLCNTAIAFDRRLDDLVLDFGTTGRLRYSNLIMYDRQTETWWQQATGEGVAGQFAGRELTFLPANIIAWSEFRDTYPESEVLSRSTGFHRSYGSNPYRGYDNVDSSPFLYEGPSTPGQLPPMARVLAVELGEETVAYTYETLQAYRVANDSVDGVPVVLFWQAGVASALDQGTVAAGQDVGTIAAFSRELDGNILTFVPDSAYVIDTATGTQWNILGQGVKGPLTGRHLSPVVGVNHFWFSWSAFKPETRVYVPDGPPPDLAEAAALPDDTSSAATLEAPSVDALTVDFEIYVYFGADTLGGEQVRLSDVLGQGKPVVVEFWAGLCPFCRRALPETQAAHVRHGDDVLFLGVDIGSFTGLGSEADARALYAELGLSFPAGSIQDLEVLHAYRITAIPTTLYFKPNGELFDRSGGGAGGGTVEEKVEALIAASGR